MGGLALISSLLKIAAVLALLVITLRVIAKYQGTRSGGRGFNRPGPPAIIEVLDQSRLGRSANVMAVRVGERVFLLGITETSVEMLADVSDDIDLTIDDDDSSELVEPSVFEHAVDLLRTGAFRK